MRVFVTRMFSQEALSIQHLAKAGRYTQKLLGIGPFEENLFRIYSSGCLA